MSKRTYIIELLIFLVFFIPLQNTKPVDQLIIVFIVDQWAHSALKKAEPYLTGGIRTFLDKGILYDEAHFPYARTSTGPGHATLNTGTLPNIHGINANYWYDENDKKVACDHDTSESAAIFSPHGFIKNGKSAHMLNVDGISDQVILASQPNAQNFVAALSLKSRAAVFCAGKLGKAVWFDAKNDAKFTSGKTYYDILPSWITQFNKRLKNLTKFYWKLRYPIASNAYSFTKNNYSFSRLPTLIHKTATPKFFQQDKHKKHPPYDIFTYNPQSNKILLDLAQEYLKDVLTQDPKKILLWISLSSLDKVGHVFGPDSLEYIDTLYHVDHYLKGFMQHVQKMVPAHKLVFALTADHGSTPIIEYLPKEHAQFAQRILTKPLEKKINNALQKKYGIEQCIQEIDIPSIFLSKKNLASIDAQKKDAIIHDIKKLLLAEPGIKRVWTHKELAETPYSTHDFVNYYKDQLVSERSGALIYQTYPYTYVTGDPLGTGHVSCYDYTTHVPLFIYQPGITVQKTIKKRVSMAQFAPTLAQKLSVPKPSACLVDPLPE